MELVKQSFEILEQKIPIRKLDDYSGSYFREEYIKELYKHIELCGRTCYRSEDKITEDSANRFINGLIKSRHLSVLEHGVVYLMYEYDSESKDSKKIVSKYLLNNHTKVTTKLKTVVSKPLDFQKIEESVKGTLISYITTNYRVIIENHWEEDLQYLCYPTQYHEKRYTVLLHSCIHAYKDLTRHRKMSFSIESTRYCNYSKTDKFGEMKFVLPPWIKEEPTNKWWLKEKEHLHQPLRKTEDDLSDFGRVWYEIPMEDIERNWETGEYILHSKWNTADIFLHGLKCVEDTYNLLIESGWQAQQAAEILPQCTAADVVISGFAKDWEFVFSLRTSYIHATGQPHPLVAEIIDPLYDEFVDRSYINKLT